MAAYHTNELILDVPAELKDNTHHLFSVSESGPSPFNVVISRSGVTSEETLETYSERLCRELKAALPKFHLSGRREMTVADTPALELRYRWENQGSQLDQIQISFFRTLSPATRQVVQITATIADNNQDVWEKMFREMIASVRLRSDTQGPDAALPPGSGR